MIESVEEPVLPWPRLALVAARAKLGADTASLKDVVADRDPEVPVTVTLYWPMVAVLLAVRVRVLFPLEMGFGEKDAVTSLGKPLMDRFTLPLNPLVGLRETVDVVEAPSPTAT